MGKLVHALFVLSLLATPLAQVQGSAAAQTEGGVADVHTLETPPLAPGQIELLTVSTFPDTVTGGDVLVQVRGLQPGDGLELRVNASPVPVPDDPYILVEGFVDGPNTLTAIADGPLGPREAELEVVNHPVTGPVISGPHQQPFKCRTEQAGLGEPIDEHCSAPTIFQWFYFSSLDSRWHELDDPSAYPADVATTELRSEDPELDGTAVPFVARVESATINRGIARIAVLDDPASRGDPDDFKPNWNGRVYHSFGESCGVGYDQARNSTVFDVLGGVPDPTGVGSDNIFASLIGLHTRVGEGDVVVHSSLTSFGNHCNPFVSMETAMMLKEHITETYPQREGLRPIRTYVGTGSSGGALQQYTAANSHPGLLDAAMPGASFADIATTGMTTTDCGLLLNYFENSDLGWDDRRRAAVTGHNLVSGTGLNSICQSWVDGFFDRTDPTTSCANGLEPEQRYHPETNPDGSRCTTHDANVNWLGRDPQTGFARRPLDNVGVQYGLRALNEGVISFEQFADLNQHIGGLDDDANFQPQRHAMSPELASLVYRVGQVIGRGALAETPIIDFAPYLDPIPVVNLHESVRPFVIRERVRRAGGDASTMAIWRGEVIQSDGFEEIDAWVAAVNANPSSGDRIADVSDAQPSTAVDQCALGTVGGRVEAPAGARTPFGVPLAVAPGAPGPDARLHMRGWVPEDHESGAGPCSAAMPPVTTTRIAAGGPSSDDVIKCRPKPIDPSDYASELTDEQLAELTAIFPDGVCDWSKPSVGDVERSILWPSLGGEDPYLDEDGQPAPVGLVWRTARSAAVPQEQTFTALSYNVAGLTDPISGSEPATNSSLISPLLNAYDLVLLQEDWADPIESEDAIDRPDGLPVLYYHHEIVSEATHPYRSEPAPHPHGTDLRRAPSGPTMVSDGLNRLSRFPFGEPRRVMWESCFGDLSFTVAEEALKAFGLDDELEEHGLMGNEGPIDGGSADCMAQKGFSVARTELAPGVEVDVYNLHGDAGGHRDDGDAREDNFRQLAEFIWFHSAGRAVIVGGDTNLKPGSDDARRAEVDGRVWDAFQASTGVVDVCAAIDCGADADVIDKFAFRSGGGVELVPLSHSFERERFTREDGEPLSDHDPLAVTFHWRVA